MPSDFDTDFAAFLDDANADPIAKKTSSDPKFVRKTFTCESCAGTGRWAGGRNRHGNAKCNTCHGSGQLVTSPAARAKARQTAAARKADTQAGNMADNIAAIGGQDRLDMLCGAGAWSEFAASLYEHHRSGKSWSEKQVAAIGGMLDKLAARAEAKAAQKAEQAAQAPSVDLGPIVAMFETAMASGYKKPMYRALGLRIKPGAGGALYVMTEDRMEFGQFGEQPGYEGKIVGGKFLAVKRAEPNTAERLHTIAADPRGEAVRHGQKTGRCSCCGRELTKHASIDAGIGPICAAKWGL